MRADFRRRLAPIASNGSSPRAAWALSTWPCRTNPILKVIKAGIASRSALRRFEHEAEILGLLRHPGIAQVFQAGVHSDGPQKVPYFAMEYLADAQTIIQYARSQNLTTASRLQLLAKVCDAVQHAHQKGVIHRDLKPGNILVDATGQPKVLDFGIARVTDADIKATTMQTDVGQLIGTLPYKLVGKPIHEAARIIREQDPIPLSSIDKTLRGDLQTIVAKALEKDRDRRYQSAESLKNDIERYLAGQPIDARADSTWYVLSKTIKRHKFPAAAAAIFIVLGIGYSLTLSLMYQRAIAAEHKAEGEAAAALRQYRLARETNEYIVTQLAEELQKVAGAGDIRRKLLQEARTKFEVLAQERSDDPRLQSDRAKTLDSLARISVELGEMDRALADQRRALAIRQTLVDQYPDDLQHLDQLALSYWGLGRLALESGQVDVAQDYATRYIQTCQRLRAADPKNTRYLDLLVVAYGELTYNAIERGDFLAARPYAEQDLQHSQQLVDADPTNLRSKELLFWAHKYQGEILTHLGELQQAGEHYTHCLEIAQETLVAQPTHPRYQDNLARAHWYLVTTKLDMGDAATAAQHAGAFHRIMLKLTQAEPEDVNHRDVLSHSFDCLGHIARHRGDLATAAQQYSQYLSINRSLAKNTPQRTHYRESVAEALGSLSGLALQRGDLHEARAMLLERTSLLDELLKKEVDNPRHRDQQADTLEKLASIADLQGRLDDARSQSAQARSLRQTLAESPQASVLVHRSFAKLLLDVPAPESRDPALALKYAKQAVERTSQLNPHMLLTLARCYLATGDPDRATQVFQQAHQRLQSFPNPPQTTLQAELQAAQARHY